MGLESKKILLGVSGSIAAYKSALIVRQLVKSGCSVKVIMTDSAKNFISALTLSTLSKNPVISEIFDKDQWNNHVEYGIWADLMLIAPASANTIAKMANGLCDNMLLATYLSARCPVFIAPGMDHDMWNHPATQANIEKLRSYPDHRLIDVDEGELASGLHGLGRMAEPDAIIKIIENHFAS